MTIKCHRRIGMTREELKARTHHDLRLPHELKAWERQQRAHAYGIRFRDWYKVLKAEHPEVHRNDFRWSKNLRQQI